MDTVMTKTLPLSRLRAGQKASVDSHEEGDFKLLLLEMGCLPGEPVTVKMIAPMGDPMAIEIAGYYLSIRKQDAARVLVALHD